MFWTDIKHLHQEMEKEKDYGFQRDDFTGCCHYCHPDRGKDDL